MRNRIIIGLCIIVGIALLILAGFWIYKHEINADTLDENDTSFVPSAADQQLLQQANIIKIPNSYTDDQIKSAQSASKTADTKTADQATSTAINNYIRSQEDMVASSLPDNPNIGDYKPVSDVVFLVADSKGEIIEPEVTKSDGATNIADNFNFGAYIEQADIDLIIRAYPVIESIYGKRQNTDKINIIREPNLGRAHTTGNNITLGSDKRPDVAIHELVHAFRSSRVLISSPLEEGSAVVVTGNVLRKLNYTAEASANDNLIRTGYKFNADDNPSVWDVNMLGTGLTPYIYGGALLDKIFREDPNFFINFNAKVYASKDYPRIGKLLQFAISCVSTIEGEESWKWFSHQYQLIPLSDNAESSRKGYFFATINNDFPTANDRQDNRLSVQIYTPDPVGNNDFSIRVLDSNNKELIPSSCFLPDSSNNNEYRVSKVCSDTPATFRNYSGLFSVEMTPLSYPEYKKSQVFFEPNNSINTADIYLYSGTGVKATFSNRDTSDTLSVPIANKYTSAKVGWLNASGRFKVEIFDASNNKINEKYFNKIDTWHVFLQMDNKNTCKNSISSITSQNHNFSLTSTTSINCGHVLTLNRLPLFRFWGKTFTPTVTNLAMNRSYGARVMTASDKSSVSIRSAVITTTNVQDFKVQSVQSSGSPISDNFKIAVVFNHAINLNTVNLKAGFYYNGAYTETPLIVKSTGSQSLEISSPIRLYNSARYSMVGLDLIRDTSGLPIYKIPDNLKNFETPINGVHPYLSLAKSIYSSTEDIIISSNFPIEALQSQLANIYITGSIHKDHCVSGVPCNRFAVTSEIRGGQLIVRLAEPLPSASTVNDIYFVVIPAVVDLNNNFVSSSSLPLYFSN